MGLAAVVTSYASSMEAAVVQPARSRATRFLGTTVVTASLGQVLILVFYRGFGWPALFANAVAVIVVAIVGFLLSIRFVWTDSRDDSRRSQMAAYLVISLIGLVISTLTVKFVTERVDQWFAANAGSFLGYGLAWMLRFLVLDRFVFRNNVA